MGRALGGCRALAEKPAQRLCFIGEGGADLQVRRQQLGPSPGPPLLPNRGMDATPRPQLRGGEKKTSQVPAHGAELASERLSRDAADQPAAAEPPAAAKTERLSCRGREDSVSEERGGLSRDVRCQSPPALRRGRL